MQKPKVRKLPCSEACTSNFRYDTIYTEKEKDLEYSIDQLMYESTISRYLLLYVYIYIEQGNSLQHDYVDCL